MSSAEIIAIGTELLLGSTADTNTSFLARELNKLGIDVFRTLIIGDNPSRIADQVLQSFSHSDVVITTGGLGPTIDDPTRQAISEAFEEELIFSDFLWSQIQERFSRFNRTPTENNKRQAFLPANAKPIVNPVGTAPAFYIYSKEKILICLPGVPSEVEFLFPEKVIAVLRKHFPLDSTTITRVIHTAGIGESSLDSLIGKFEELSNPTVGVTAKPGQVDIRITAKADDISSVEKMIAPIEREIVALLSKYVYGYDDDSLLGIVKQKKSDLGAHLSLSFLNTNHVLIEGLTKLELFDSIEELKREDQNWANRNRSMYNNDYKKFISVIVIENDHEFKQFTISINDGEKEFSEQRQYGSHPNLVDKWIENYILNTIRNIF